MGRNPKREQAHNAKLADSERLFFSFFFPLIISQAWHIGMAKVLKKWEWDQVQKIPINSIKIQFKINLVLT